MFVFSKKYFLFACVLLLAEILIAAYMHDPFIRPYFGDFLVVMLIYCFVKSFLNSPVLKTAIAVLLFSYAVEISQYFNLVAKLGLLHSRMAKIIMGSSFGWEDMAAYTLGVLTILILERKKITYQADLRRPAPGK